jgi:hypothetical protein
MIIFVRNLFIRDFWLKLLSLVLAILIWKIVSLAIRHEVSPAAGPLLGIETSYKDVPVLIMSTAEDVRSFKVNPTMVEVSVRMDATKAPQIQADDIRAIVDLTGIESARDLRREIRVITPPDVTFVRVVPDHVDVIVPPKK